MNADMRKFETSQKEESRAQSADSSKPVVLKLCTTPHVPRENYKCAAELFGIFENHQFVLKSGMQESMRDLNACYPLHN